MKHFAIAAGMFAVAATAAAQVVVTDPWVRGTVPHQASTGAFMQLTAQDDSRVLSVQSPVARLVEIHQMTMENDVMTMRPVTELALPAGKTVALKPGGYHIMMTGLRQQMKEGDLIPITLVVQSKDNARHTIEVKAPVRALNSMTGSADARHRGTH